MKNKIDAISRFIDEAYPFVMLFGFGYAGYTLNQYGETFAVIALAVSMLLWFLERHNYIEK